MDKILVAAVDFGSKKISASLGVEDGKELEILGSLSVLSRGIKKGLITNKEKCVEDIRDVLIRLEEESGKKINSIYVGIPSRNLRVTEFFASVNLEEGKVRVKDIERALERGKRNVILSDGEEIAELIVNYFLLDEEIINGDIKGLEGNILTLNITAVIGNEEYLAVYKDVVEEAGYKINGFVVNIIAGRQVFVQGKSAKANKALIDIGAGTTDIAIFKDGIAKYIYSIPIGGNNITKDLSVCLNLTMSEAEKAKMLYSSGYETLYNDESIELIESDNSKVSKKLFYEIINARIDELFNYIKLELKNSSYFEGICSIIIYGEGLSYYENVKNVARANIDHKFTIVTGKDLGMQDSENITSLAIVKEVYDREKLFIDENILAEQMNFENEIVIEKLEKRKEPEGLVRKLKSFLEDIF